MQSAHCAGDSQHMPCHSRAGVRWWTNREANAEGRAGVPQVQGQEEFMAQGLCLLRSTHFLSHVVCQASDCTSHNGSRCFKIQSIQLRLGTAIQEAHMHAYLSHSDAAFHNHKRHCVPWKPPLSGWLHAPVSVKIQNLTFVLCLVGSWCGYEPCRAPSRWW